MDLVSYNAGLSDRVHLMALHWWDSYNCYLSLRDECEGFSIDGISLLIPKTTQMPIARAVSL